MGLTASRESSAILGGVLLLSAVALGLGLASAFARMQVLAGDDGFASGGGSGGGSSESDGLLTRMVLAMCAGDGGEEEEEEEAARERAARERTPLVRPLSESRGHLAAYGVNVSRVQATTRADLAYKAPKPEERALDHAGY
jgi:hypothetical protein